MTPTRNCAASPMAPCSPQTEKAVLGCCQLHPGAYHTAAAMIGDRPVFFEPKLARIWSVLADWYAGHECRPDGAYIVGTLGTDVTLAAECVSVSALTPNLPYYCNELLRLWRLRRSRDLAAILPRNRRRRQRNDYHGGHVNRSD